MAEQYHNTNFSGSDDSTARFKASDFLQLDDWFDALNPTDFSSVSHLLNYMPHELELESSRAVNSSFSEKTIINKRETVGIREKVSFKTKSEIEVLEDGFKWRKYGKKMVKNSPNPRNYYKCSVEGCPVKKRVERDREDRRYVLTTYEAIHNHEAVGPKS